MRHFLMLIAGAVIALGILFAMGGSKAEIVAGGLYSAKAGQDAWGIIKVIAHDDKAISVRIYSNTFKTRPAHVEPSELFIAGFKDPSGHTPGIGHLPVTADVFHAWAPKLIRTAEISEEELNSYREFKEAGGMPFDLEMLQH